MKRHTVIAISGKMGSGKTTLAKNLCSHYSGTHLKFALPLYEMHEAIRGVLKKYDFHGMPEKSGELLQYLGTEFGRKKLGENIWADLTRSAIEKNVEVCEKFNDKAFIVVDDARFENELELFFKFRSHFPEWRVLTVRLEADELTRKSRADGWRDNTQHPSEIALDHRINDFDLIISTQSTSSEHVYDIVRSEIEG